MKTISANEYMYITRWPLKEQEISSEYLQLSRSLKTLVSMQGEEIYSDKERLAAAIKESKLPYITEQHIKMISVILKQIASLLNKARFVDDETAVEQMYCFLLKNGYSRNSISGLIYAVFFSLDKQLKLSKVERERLCGKDTFVKSADRKVKVCNDNIGDVEAAVEKGDRSAMAEMGNQILIGKIEKYKADNSYGEELCEEALNYGSGRAARFLGNYFFERAKRRLLSNDDYSRAYEVYTVYGAKFDNDNLDKTHVTLVDIFNLGIYNQRMIFNYLLCAVAFSVTFFLPLLLNDMGVATTLTMPIAVSVTLTALEFLTVVFGIIVRRVRPFFTQGWIVLMQSVIWFVGLLIMVV